VPSESFRVILLPLKHKPGYGLEIHKMPEYLIVGNK